jgi:DNA adenine methylase
MIEATYQRLQNVQIECLPYEQVFEKFDRPGTLFFLDPPYWNRKLYKFNFEKEDFIKFERRLRELKGKFILTLNDEPEVRALFSRFTIKPVQLAYSAQQENGKKFNELLITNFPLT